MKDPAAFWQSECASLTRRNRELEQQLSLAREWLRAADLLEAKIDTAMAEMKTEMDLRAAFRQLCGQ